MNAKQARTLTELHRKGKAVDNLIPLIMAKVEKAARAGLSEVVDPFYNLIDPASLERYRVSPEQEDTLRKILSRQGYTIRDNPNPDPGHPCSHAYASLEW